MRLERPRPPRSRLTLSNELKPEWEQYAKKVEEGWSGILEGLAKVLP